MAGVGQEGLSGPGIADLDCVLPFQNEKRFFWCIVQAVELIRAAFERAGGFEAWKHVRETPAPRVPRRGIYGAPVCPSARPGPVARAYGVQSGSCQARGRREPLCP